MIINSLQVIFKKNYQGKTEVFSAFKCPDNQILTFLSIRDSELIMGSFQSQTTVLVQGNFYL